MEIAQRTKCEEERRRTREREKETRGEVLKKIAHHVVPDVKVFVFFLRHCICPRVSFCALLRFTRARSIVVLTLFFTRASTFLLFFQFRDTKKICAHSILSKRYKDNDGVVPCIALLTAGRRRCALLLPMATTKATTTTMRTSFFSRARPSLTTRECATRFSSRRRDEDDEDSYNKDKEEENISSTVRNRSRV